MMFFSNRANKNRSMYTNMGFSGICSLSPKGNFVGKNNYRVTVPESTFYAEKTKHYIRNFRIILTQLGQNQPVVDHH